VSVFAASSLDEEQPVIANAITDAAAIRRIEPLRIQFSISFKRVSIRDLAQRGPSNL
jgi:hypothetical protein